MMMLKKTSGKVMITTLYITVYSIYSGTNKLAVPLKLALLIFNVSPQSDTSLQRNRGCLPCTLYTSVWGQDSYEAILSGQTKIKRRQWLKDVPSWKTVRENEDSNSKPRWGIWTGTLARKKSKLQKWRTIMLIQNYSFFFFPSNFWKS